MSTRGEQAMQVLGRFGELAWFKLTSDFNPECGYRQVSYMGWRYKDPRRGVAQLIESVVSVLPTQVEWMLDMTRRNWLLLPTRIVHEAHGLENPAFASVVHSINEHDQDFCLKALSDFEIIMDALREASIPVAD